MPEDHLTYSYCVTTEPMDVGMVENQPGGLYKISEADLCAIACRVEARNFGRIGLRRNSEDAIWMAAETEKHERVVEAVMRDRSVIPLPFATLFNADEGVRAWLRTHRREFARLLRRLENKGEWRVRVHHSMRRLGDCTHNRVTEMSRLGRAICPAGAGEASSSPEKWEKSGKPVMAETEDRCAQEIGLTLAKLSFQARMNGVLPWGVGERYGTVILNAAFLVSDQNAGAFVDAMNVLSDRYVEDGLFIECNGPWPPYNFCRLPKIGLRQRFSHP